MNLNGSSWVNVFTGIGTTRANYGSSATSLFYLDNLASSSVTGTAAVNISGTFYPVPPLIFDDNFL